MGMNSPFPSHPIRSPPSLPCPPLDSSYPSLSCPPLSGSQGYNPADNVPNKILISKLYYLQSEGSISVLKHPKYIKDVGHVRKFLLAAEAFQCVRTSSRVQIRV